MTIEILKGTTSIGGALTTITTSKGTKIMCDFGMDLDDILRLPEIERLKYRRANLFSEYVSRTITATIMDELTRFFLKYLFICQTKQGA